MRVSRIIQSGFAALAVAALMLPASASACATCFGKSDSAMAQGMNAGILTLLLVIMSVLLAIAIFFAYILRRAARLNAAQLAAPADAQAQPVSQRPVSLPTS